MVELGVVESLSYEMVRPKPKKRPHAVAQAQWCILKVDGEFLAAKADVLDLYAEAYDPSRPVVCFEETSTQLLTTVRQSLPVQPGRPRRQDYEYRRGGPATSSSLVNHWLVFATWPSPNSALCRTLPDRCSGCWTQPSPTPRDPSGSREPEHHRMASLYETLPAAEGRPTVERLECSHTPKHASWLNMAEIEFSIFTRDYLGGRHGADVALAGAIDAYETRRNDSRPPSTGASAPGCPNQAPSPLALQFLN